MFGQSIWEHTFKIFQVTERQLWFSMWPMVSTWTEVHLLSPLRTYTSPFGVPPPVVDIFRSRFAGKMDNMVKSKNHVKLHSAFLSDPFSISLTSLSIARILLLATPFFSPKHQAFAPPSTIPLSTKLKVCQRRVRFEAFGQGLRVQLLNWSNSGSVQSSLPSCEFLRLFN